VLPRDVGCGKWWLVRAVTKLEYTLPLEIAIYPHPCLRADNAKLDCFDESLQELTKAMFEIMYRTDGVGLAAPQVGVNVRLMVYNPEGDPRTVRAPEPQTPVTGSLAGLHTSGLLREGVEMTLSHGR
jgi:hypothetical protein